MKWRAIKKLGLAKAHLALVFVCVCVSSSVHGHNNNSVSASVVVLPAVTTLINPNSESDITKPIHRQTIDAGFRDFTVTLAV